MYIIDFLRVKTILLFLFVSGLFWIESIFADQEVVTEKEKVLTDLEVRIAKESELQELELSFSLSTTNFANDPSNLRNDPSNLRNSLSNFSNSPSNFKNSPSEYPNGKSGNRRLLLEQGKSYLYVGYYAPGEEGLINIFSSKGKRLFYSPSRAALFGSEDGEFCGTLTTTFDGENVLVLTEKGQLAFMQEGIPLPSQSEDKPKLFRPEEPKTATTLKKQAEHYQAQDTYAEEEPLYKRALGVREKALGKSHPDVGTSTSFYKENISEAISTPTLTYSIGKTIKLHNPSDSCVGLYKDSSLKEITILFVNGVKAKVLEVKDSTIYKVKVGEKVGWVSGSVLK